MKGTCPSISLFVPLCLNLAAFSATTRFYAGVSSSSLPKRTLSISSFSSAAANTSTDSADASSPTSLPPLRFTWSSEWSEENTKQTLWSDSSLLDRNLLPTYSAALPHPSRSPVSPPPHILRPTLKSSPTALHPPFPLAGTLTRRGVQSSSIIQPDLIPGLSDPSLTSPSPLPPSSDSPSPSPSSSSSYTLTLTILAFALPAFLLPLALLLLISLLRTRRREAALARKLASLQRAQFRLHVARSKRERNRQRRRVVEGEGQGGEDVDREGSDRGRAGHMWNGGLCEMHSPVRERGAEEREGRWRKQMELQAGEWVVEMGEG